jgi:hypothetical protein
MPSPFPGMNPYLEHPSVWLGFHAQFVPAVSHALNARLGGAYIALVEEQVYIHEVDENVVRLAGRADVGLARHPEREPGTPAASAVLDAPLRVIVPAATAEALARVEVRTRAGKELVTVIEVLSPTNKRGGWHREQYATKRALILNSEAHFVEIDLLRGWERMPVEGAVDSDYRVLVSRAEDRPSAGLWAVSLRERLPQIPVPLRGADPPVKIDLQALVHQVYDAATYRKVIYDDEPRPPLSSADAAWAAAIAAREPRE